MLVEDYPSVFSANFPFPPTNREKGRFVADSSYRRIPFEVHVSRNACGTSEKGEGNCRLQQMSGNFEASRGTRRGNDRLSANFNQQDPRTFRRKRSKRLAVKFNPLLGFTIDLSKESSVGRTLSNPATDSDNIIGPMHRVFSKSWSHRNHINASFGVMVYIDICFFSRTINRIQLKLIISTNGEKDRFRNCNSK